MRPLGPPHPQLAVHWLDLLQAVMTSGVHECSGSVIFRKCCFALVLFIACSYYILFACSPKMDHEPCRRDEVEVPLMTQYSTETLDMFLFGNIFSFIL